MLGLVVGTVCLVALTSMVASGARRRAYAHAMHGGFGGYGYGGPGWGTPGWGPGGPGGWGRHGFRGGFGPGGGGCGHGGHGCGGHGRWHRYGGHGHGGWHGGWHGDGDEAGWRSPDFTRAAAWGLKARLGLDDAQADVVAAAMDDARKVADTFVGELKDARGDVAEALQGETIDEARLNAVFEMQDQAIATARKDLVDALRKAHAALEPEQRAKAAEWLAGKGKRGTWL